MDRPTETLLAQATTGDSAAIESLLERYLPELRGFVARRVGARVQGRESVADLAQSVCRETLEHLRDGRLRFQGEAEFKQWLYRAAALKLMNRARFWRAAGRDEQHPVAAAPSAEGGEERWPDEAGTPSEAAIVREEAERFAAALETLAPEQREAVTLFHVEGLSHAEIGQRLGVTESHSRTLLARGLARMARQVRRGADAAD